MVANEREKTHIRKIIDVDVSIAPVDYRRIVCFNRAAIGNRRKKKNGEMVVDLSVDSGTIARAKFYIVFV